MAGHKGSKWRTQAEKQKARREPPQGWEAPLGFPLSSHSSPQVSKQGAPRMGPDFFTSVLSVVTLGESLAQAVGKEN